MPDSDPRTIRIAATEETQLREATKALQQSEASLHAVSMQLLQTQDQERRRVARDLHDVTGQELAVALMSLDHLTRTLEDKKGDAGAGREECKKWTGRGGGEIRPLSWVPPPPMLDEMGLGGALGVFTQGFTKRT